MNITPINSNNSQQTFNGYVHKDILKVINAATNNCLKDKVKLANKANEKVNIKTLEEISEFRDNIIQNLTNYMDKLHKDTYLSLNNAETTFILKNKKLKDVTYYQTPFFGEKTKIFTVDDKFDEKTYNGLDLQKLSFKHLEKINEFVNKLVTIDSEAVNKKMFEAYTSNIIFGYSAIGKFISRLRAKKADKLAPEFKQPAIWLEKIEKTFYGDSLKAIKERKLLAKKTKKENYQTLKQYLK